MKRSLNSRFLPLALAAALVLGAFTGCGKGGEPPALEGTPPQIELDGYTLTLSQTTLQEVLDAGFEKVERLGFEDETIPPYTFSSDLYYLARAGEDQCLSQYFAVLTNTRSVGVMGDGRTYDYTLALRSVTTTDFMTADWTRIPYEVLDRVSVRIVNEVPNINRIVYDITSKPPATIEWE